MSQPLPSFSMLPPPLPQPAHPQQLQPSHSTIKPQYQPSPSTNHTPISTNQSQFQPPISTQPLLPSTPPWAVMMPPPTLSPRRLISEIMSQFSKEKDAGRVAVHLAQFYFFGESVIAKTTAARLDPIQMEEIKHLIISKFAGNRSMADKEDLWRRCRVAIGQKCKLLRAKKGS